MKGPYSMFRTDPKVEALEGIVLNYGPFNIRVARAGGANAKFRTVLTDRLRPYRKQMEMGSMDDDVAQKLLAEVYADSVILGWEGVTNAEGKILPFTRDNVIKVLLDLPDLFKDVQEQASLLSNFKAEALEDEAKN